MSSTELTHFRSRNEFEIFGVRSLRVEEFHGIVGSVKSSNFEGVNLNSTEESLGVDKELLSVPSIV